MSFSFHDDSEDHAPRILVLMATFNGAAWLREQIDSILVQQGVSVRLIVSDDGSSDDTSDLVDRWASHDPRIQRLETAESRLGATGNFLRLLHDADFADAEFVALSDQDDVWEADRL